jgi:hypothetical protein
MPGRVPRAFHEPISHAGASEPSDLPCCRMDNIFSSRSSRLLLPESSPRIWIQYLLHIGLSCDLSGADWLST